jgi:hypothetical protein
MLFLTFNKRAIPELACGTNLPTAGHLIYLFIGLKAPMMFQGVWWLHLTGKPFGREKTKITFGHI